MARSRALAARSGSACDGTLLVVAIEGLLLDIDGVLAVSWEALPGAVDAHGVACAKTASRSV